MIGLLLWDIDDVLVDTTSRIRRGQRAALELLGFREQLDRVNACWEHLYWYYSQADASEIISVLLAEFGVIRGNAEICLAADRYLTYANQGPFDVHRGIVEALEWAGHNRIPNGIVSNGNRSFQIEKLAESQLIKYFDASLIEIRGKGERPKPSPDGISSCVSRSGVDAAGTVYIGNRLTDVIAANRAGCISMYIASGNFDFKEPVPTLLLEKADIVLRDTSEILDRLIDVFTCGRAG